MFSQDVTDEPLDVLGIKQSPSFHDWDTIGLSETFMGNKDAVGAVQSVEREIQSINARFEGKELNAFGKDEEVVLQRFQELRRRQVDLSRRQVELLSRKQRGRFDDTVAGGLDQLAQDMQKLCSMIAEVESLAEPEKKAAAAETPKDKGEADNVENNNNASSKGKTENDDDEDTSKSGTSAPSAMDGAPPERFRTQTVLKLGSVGNTDDDDSD